MDRQNRLGSVLALELAPAAFLNFAVAFAAASFLEGVGLEELAAPVSVVAGIAAFLLGWTAIRRFAPCGGRFDLPPFESHALAEGETFASRDPNELLLTDVVAMDRVQHPVGDELLLDDVLASLGPDSRVVRLFDPAAMPTAGELRERIDRHLSGGSAPPVPDATQELHEALAALRQSLR